MPEGLDQGLDSGLLSQDEVDSLLNMLAEGDETEPPPDPSVGALDPHSEIVRRYDFHQPGRFSKEHLRTLRMIHENMARRLALQLSTKMRTSIDVNLAFIDTGPYASFIEQLSDTSSAMHLISLKPLPGRILVQYDNRLTDMLVDRLLGGAGNPASNVDRELTDLELDLLSSVTVDVIGAIEDSWQGTVDLTGKLEETLTNPYFVQVALPSDTCAWISFEMAVNGHGAALNFCIPASVLKPISPKLSPQAWIAGSEQQADEENWALARKHIRRHLEHLQLEMTALLPGGELILADLISLQVGDVIPLQRHISEEVIMTMQDQEKMKGQLGVYHGKLAVEVTEIFESLDEALGS